MSGEEPRSPSSGLALAWTRVAREATCDVRLAWEHGTILRATRYPSWWDRNLVRVEERPALDGGGLLAVADRALDGLAHRLISFDEVSWGTPYRAAMQAAGYRTTRLVWMHHPGDRGLGDPGRAVTEVGYDEVSHLRRAWHHEDFPDDDPSDYHALMREHALAHGTRVLASLDEYGSPVGFSTLDPVGDQVEVGAVYVLPEHRGQGRGTALTRAAIAAGAAYEHVWICADADDRPQHLYARLGFEPVLWTIEFLRPPRPGQS